MYGLYVVLDKVGEKFSPPFVSVNDASAKRSHKYSMQKVPEDDRDSYILYNIGTYNDDTGICVITEHREVI